MTDNQIAARIHRSRAASYLRARRGYARHGLPDLAAWAAGEARRELTTAWMLRSMG